MCWWSFGPPAYYSSRSGDKGSLWYALVKTRMRKVILGAGMGLDSYVARPDGEIDFLYQPKGYSMAALFAKRLREQLREQASICS
jgi:hypothetical protein